MIKINNNSKFFKSQTCLAISIPFFIFKNLDFNQQIKSAVTNLIVNESLLCLKKNDYASINKKFEKTSITNEHQMIVEIKFQIYDEILLIKIVKFEKNLFNITNHQNFQFLIISDDQNTICRQIGQKTKIFWFLSFNNKPLVSLTTNIDKWIKLIFFFQINQFVMLNFIMKIFALNFQKNASNMKNKFNKKIQNRFWKLQTALNQMNFIVLTYIEFCKFLRFNSHKSFMLNQMKWINSKKNISHLMFYSWQMQFLIWIKCMKYYLPNYLLINEMNLKKTFNVLFYMMLIFEIS